MSRIKNKVALITGAARGIGKATASLFHAEGAKVILTDILEAEGQAAAQEIGCAFHPLNAAKENEWQVLTQWIQNQYGKLDILFNNAGISGLEEEFGPQDPEHASLSSWQEIHHINLDSIFLGCKYGIQLMKKTGGAIVNMSSRSGMVGVPNACAYASSKAAIRNHTKSVALYCAEKHYHIRCNSVHPAAIETEMWDVILNIQDAKEREIKFKNLAAGIPLGHMGDPMDVAYAVLYLASDESKYITGTELTLDGGILAGCSASLKRDEP